MAVISLGTHSVDGAVKKIGETTQNVLNVTPLGSVGDLPPGWSLLIYESWGTGSFAFPITRCFPYGGPTDTIAGIASSVQLTAPNGVNREIRIATDRQIFVDCQFLSIVWSDLAVP
jgi:hypothetical protein